VPSNVAMPPPVEGGGGGSSDWADITGKPATFPPSTHSHETGEVTGLDAALAGKVNDTGDTFSGPIVLPSGTAAATSLNFGTAGSGLYFASSAVNVSISGASKLSVGPTLSTLTTMLRVIDGTVAAPSYSFTNNSNMGLWRVGANQLGFATLGVNRLTLSDTAFTSTLPVVLPAAPTADLQAATKKYVDDRIVQLTQAAYDALTPKVATTLYIVVG
jgi:hypothetical protein